MRLFEIVLLEYNRDITLTKFGDRIAQAAAFNETYMEDNWFYTLLPGDQQVESEEDLAVAVLSELENMDPTANKQYVMTLVRWYTGVNKKQRQLQSEYEQFLKRLGDQDQSQFPNDFMDIEHQIRPGSRQGMEIDNGLRADDTNIDYSLTPQNLNTFKLEDAEQVRDAIERFHEMKPQLPENQRDINRYKSFYRFEDFVDQATNFDSDLGAEETSDKTLSKSDVEVVYNGPKGTVTIPKSHRASCELGRGTRWCTASKNNDEWYRSYSEKGDLIIYNEKPGNAKYQFLISFRLQYGDMEFTATDARDRELDNKMKDYYLNKHPIMSPILQKVERETFDNAMNNGAYRDSNRSIDITKTIKLNAKYGGGAKPFIDTHFLRRLEGVDVTTQQVGMGMGRGIEQAVAYAQQRGKPWPAFEELSIKQLNSFLMDISGAKTANSNISGGGPAYKGDALMSLMRKGLVGKSGKFLAIYLRALKIYRDKVNPNWKALALFFQAYRNMFGAHRDKNIDPITKKPSMANTGPPKTGQVYPNTPFDGPDNELVPPIHPVEEMRMLLNKIKLG